jgi:hypothetical protein
MYYRHWLRNLLPSVHFQVASDYPTSSEFEWFQPIIGKQPHQTFSRKRRFSGGDVKPTSLRIPTAAGEELLAFSRK